MTVLAHTTRALARARARRAAYRTSVHYAIDHAHSAAERNELVTMATRQGVGV